MSYTVFALKWRPQNFDEIVGQDHIATTLKNTLQKDRLANAYLFAGPRGVGKTSTARILAKSLNCKEGPTTTPCGKCSSCVEIAKGTSLDVMEIDGASNRQIDDIRTLRENVKFAPTLGKFKVYIIDEVHMLTTEAFNALLKTLEEPPPFVKFIFATTHPHKIPTTILSRCQRLDFRRILAMEIVNQLTKIVAAEKINIDKEVLFAIAKSSDGSLRDAESILDQLVSFCEKKVSLRDIVSILGLIEQDVLFEITDKIIRKDPSGALQLFNKIIDDGKDIGLFVTNLIEHFRNLMIAKITQADANLIDLPQETCKKLLEQSQALSLEEIFSAFNVLAATNEMGKRMDSLRIPLEINLVKLAHNKSNQSPAQIQGIPEVKQVSENKIKYTPAPTQVPAKPAVTERAPLKQETKHFDKDDIFNQPKEIKKEEKPQKIAGTPMSLDDIKGVWKNAIDSLSKVKMSVATYFNEGNAVGIDGNNTLTVSFPKDYSLHKESLEKKENKVLIEKTLSGLLNNKLNINFILSQEVSKQSQDDSLIKNVMNTFGGRLIKEG